MTRSYRFLRTAVTGAALWAAVGFPLVAMAKLSKTGASATSFGATGPGGLHIDGKTADLNLADDGTTITITVPLANLDTGIGLRNKHTGEALETSKYPSAELRVARSALKFPAAGAQSTGDAKGQLTIHGQTKEISFHYMATLDGGTLSIKGSAYINVTDFGVKPPSYAGVAIKPDITLSTSFQAKDN